MFAGDPRVWGRVACPDQLSSSDPEWNALATGSGGRGVWRMNTHAVQQARRVSVCVLTALIAVSTAMGPVSAMEAGAFNRSTAVTASSTDTLPSFLDIERLPDLQQAWRNRFNAAPAANAVIPSQHTNNGTDTDDRSSSVRSRAEELSHRFTFGDEAPPQSATSNYAMPRPDPATPAATASVDHDGAVSPAAPSGDQALAPIDAEPVEEPVTSSAMTIDDPGTAVTAEGTTAPDDQIARALDGASAPAVTDAVASPAPSTAAAKPATRTVNIARPVRKDLTGIAQKDRLPYRRPDASGGAKATAQKREKRASVPVVAAKKAPSPSKQVATSKSSGPLYYFNNSSSSSATAPDRHILMPSQIQSFGWSD